jgi:hypothetical protein
VREIRQSVIQQRFGCFESVAKESSWDFDGNWSALKTQFLATGVALKSHGGLFSAD